MLYIFINIFLDLLQNMMIGGQMTEETIGDHLGGEEGRRTLEIIIEEEEGEDISGEVCCILSFQKPQYVNYYTMYMYIEVY